MAKGFAASSETLSNPTPQASHPPAQSAPLVLPLPLPPISQVANAGNTMLPRDPQPATAQELLPQPAAGSIAPAQPVGGSLPAPAPLAAAEIEIEASQLVNKDEENKQLQGEKSFSMEQSSPDIWNDFVNFATSFWEDLKMPSAAIEVKEEGITESEMPPQVGEQNSSKDARSYVEDGVEWTETSGYGGVNVLVKDLAVGAKQTQIRPMEVDAQSVTMAKKAGPEKERGAPVKLGASAPAVDPNVKKVVDNLEEQDSKEQHPVTNSISEQNTTNTEQVQLGISADNHSSSAERRDEKAGGASTTAARASESAKKPKAGCFSSMYRKKAPKESAAVKDNAQQDGKEDGMEQAEQQPA
eukprot:758928-Hanusia_phi.AAC.1